MEQKEFTLDNPQQFITDMQALIDEQKALVRQLEEQFAEFKRKIAWDEAGAGLDKALIDEIEIPAPYGVRFINVCRSVDIYTVADLLRFGECNFRRLRNMGEKTIRFTKRALKDQYGVDWPYDAAKKEEDE